MKKEYRNVIKTKKAIREAFADLISEKNDIYKVTVTELVTHANIAKSTFYLHYDDVFSVAEEFENELIETLKSIIDNTEQNVASFENSFNLVIKYLKENEEVYSKILNSSQSIYFIDEIKRVLTRHLFNKISSPNLSNDPNIKNAQIMFLANGSIDLAIDYFRNNINISLEEIKKIILDFIKFFN